MTPHVILGVEVFSVLGVRQKSFGQVEALSQYKYFTSASLATCGHHDELRQEPRSDKRLMTISKTWTNSSEMKTSTD